MKNQISPEAIRRIRRASKVLIRKIAADSKNSLEKFLMQQNLIQYHLAELIILRAKSLDKDLFNWIENKTLGTLIKIYRICAVPENDELALAGLLKQYNQKRNYLVHKIVKDSNYTELEERAEAANKEGMRIIEILDKLVEKKKISDAIMHKLTN